MILTSNGTSKQPCVSHVFFLLFSTTKSTTKKITKIHRGVVQLVSNGHRLSTAFADISQRLVQCCLGNPRDTVDHGGTEGVTKKTNKSKQIKDDLESGELCNGHCMMMCVLFAWFVSCCLRQSLLERTTDSKTTQKVIEVTLGNHLGC